MLIVIKLISMPHFSVLKVVTRLSLNFPSGHIVINNAMYICGLVLMIHEHGPIMCLLVNILYVMYKLMCSIGSVTSGSKKSFKPD